MEEPDAGVLAVRSPWAEYEYVVVPLGGDEHDPLAEADQHSSPSASKAWVTPPGPVVRSLALS